MTEKELFEIMKKEFPPIGKVAFMLGVYHWSHIQGGGEATSYRLSMIPGGKEECHIIYSTDGWQDIYDKYLIWKEEQDE